MIEEFKEDLISGWQGDCPCCGRYAQVYKRRLHTSVCLQLIKLYKLGGWHKYVHISQLIPKGVGGSGDFTKAKYWKLIVEQPTDAGEKSNGGWMLTPDGVAYVRNQIALPEWAYVYDDQVLKYDGRMVRIAQAVEKKFDYSEIMEAV